MCPILRSEKLTADTAYYLALAKEADVVVGGDQVHGGRRQRVGGRRHRDGLRPEGVDLDARHVVRQPVRAVHRHGKPEDAVRRRVDGEVRHRHFAAVVGDDRRRRDRRVGPRAPFLVAQNAVQLDRHRLRADREPHRAARRRRPHRLELVEDERDLRQVRVPGERDAPAVVPHGAHVLVGCVVVDFRRVLIARRQPAQRRMDHVRDARHDLRDRRALRGEDLGRIDVDRAPVDRKIVPLDLGRDRAAAPGLGGEDAVDGPERNAEGERRAVLRGVVGERAGQQVEALAANDVGGAAVAAAGIAAERRVDDERLRPIPRHSQGAAILGGIAREGRRQHRDLGIARFHVDRAAAVVRVVAEERAVVDAHGCLAVDEDGAAVVRHVPALEGEVRERKRGLVRRLPPEFEVPRIRPGDDHHAVRQAVEPVDFERPHARRDFDFPLEPHGRVAFGEFLEGHAPPSVRTDEQRVGRERVDGVAQPSSVQ